MSKVWTVPGLGLGTTDQRVPSQDSTNVLSELPLVENAPTAVHASAATHDTPPRSLPVLPGLGVCTTASGCHSRTRPGSRRGHLG